MVKFLKVQRLGQSKIGKYPYFEDTWLPLQHTSWG